MILLLFGLGRKGRKKIEKKFKWLFNRFDRSFSNWLHQKQGKLNNLIVYFDNNL